MSCMLLFLFTKLISFPGLSYFSNRCLETYHFSSKILLLMSFEGQEDDQGEGQEDDFVFRLFRITHNCRMKLLKMAKFPEVSLEKGKISRNFAKVRKIKIEFGMNIDLILLLLE